MSRLKEYNSYVDSKLPDKRFKNQMHETMGQFTTYLQCNPLYILTSLYMSIYKTHIRLIREWSFCFDFTKQCLKHTLTNYFLSALATTPASSSARAGAKEAIHFIETLQPLIYHF